MSSSIGQVPSFSSDASPTCVSSPRALGTTGNVGGRSALDRISQLEAILSDPNSGQVVISKARVELKLHYLAKKNLGQSSLAAQKELADVKDAAVASKLKNKLEYAVLKAKEAVVRNELEIHQQLLELLGKAVDEQNLAQARTAQARLDALSASRDVDAAQRELDAAQAKLSSLQTTSKAKQRELDQVLKIEDYRTKEAQHLQTETTKNEALITKKLVNAGLNKKELKLICQENEIGKKFDIHETIDLEELEVVVNDTTAEIQGRGESSGESDDVVHHVGVEAHPSLSSSITASSSSLSLPVELSTAMDKQQSELSELLQKFAQHRSNQEQQLAGLQSEVERLNDKCNKSQWKELLKLRKNTATQKEDLTSADQQLKLERARIETLEADVSHQRSRVSTLEADVASKSQRLQQLESQTSSQSTTITKLQNDNANHRTTIQELEGNLADLVNDVASKRQQIEVLESDSVSQRECIGRLENENKQHKNTIKFLDLRNDSADSQFEHFQTRIDTLEKDYATQREQIQSLENSNKLHKNTIQFLNLQNNSAEGQFESFQEKIDALEKENASQREQIQSLENANKLHKNTIQFLNLQNNSAEGQFESLQQKVDTLEKENTSQREQIQSLENANKLHKNTIQFLNLQNNSAEGQFESFQEKIDTLEKENTSQREQIQSLENANKLHKNTIQFLNLQNTSTDERFEELQEKIDALEKDNSSQRETIQSLENANKLHKNTIQFLNLQNMSTDNKFEEYQEKIESLEKDNSNHQEKVQSLENVIKLHKNTIQYLNLQIRSAEELHDRIEELEQTNASQKETIAKLENDIFQYTNDKELLEARVFDLENDDEAEELKVLADNLQDTIDALEETNARQQVTISALESDIDHYTNDIELLESRVTELEDDTEVVELKTSFEKTIEKNKVLEEIKSSHEDIIGTLKNDILHYTDSVQRMEARVHSLENECEIKDIKIRLAERTNFSQRDEILALSNEILQHLNTIKYLDLQNQGAEKRLEKLENALREMKTNMVHWHRITAVMRHELDIVQEKRNLEEENLIVLGERIEEEEQILADTKAALVNLDKLKVQLEYRVMVVNEDEKPQMREMLADTVALVEDKNRAIKAHQAVKTGFATAVADKKEILFLHELLTDYQSKLMEWRRGMNGTLWAPSDILLACIEHESKVDAVRKIQNIRYRSLQDTLQANKRQSSLNVSERGLEAQNEVAELRKKLDEITAEKEEYKRQARTETYQLSCRDCNLDLRWVGKTRKSIITTVSEHFEEIWSLAQRGDDELDPAEDENCSAFARSRLAAHFAEHCRDVQTKEEALQICYKAIRVERMKKKAKKAPEVKTLFYWGCPA